MRIGTLLGFVLIPIVACLVLAWLGQRRLIYFPLSRNVPPAATRWPAASDVGFGTEDGLLLAGWFVPSSASGQSITVLVFNGNAGNRESRLPLAVSLAASGFSVLLFDYRGYGGNPGRPTEKGLIADARAARAYLGSRSDVDPDGIVYYGESLGAAVAVALATEQPPAALVLRSPFTSLEDVARKHYPFLPVRLLLRDRYPSIERISGVDVPVLVVAGDSDSIVPYEQSRQLFEAAPSAMKRFVSVPGADHNDVRLTAGDEVIDTITAFLGEIQ